MRFELDARLANSGCSPNLLCKKMYPFPRRIPASSSIKYRILQTIALPDYKRKLKYDAVNPKCSLALQKKPFIVSPTSGKQDDTKQVNFETTFTCSSLLPFPHQYVNLLRTRKAQFVP